MIKHFSLIFVFIFSSLLAQSTEKLNFKFGKPVSVDGCFNTGEWSDAQSVDLKVNDNIVIKIFYKHDGANLLFAFCKNLKGSNNEFRFPEILLDINNTKTGNWDSEDYWFHVSATDCDSKGHRNDYNNCLAVQPDWLGEKNFMDPLFNDTVEISIPFTKVGIDPNQNKVFGIAFDVTDTWSFWQTYPPSASIDNPSTWAEGEIIPNDSEVEELSKLSIEIYPNPVSDFLYLDNNSLIDKIEIYSEFGLKVLETKWKERIDVTGMVQGVYFIRIGDRVCKFIKM